MSKVAEALKAIIDREGLGYLDTNAYDVYTELLKNKAADAKTARMILITLLAGTHRQKKIYAVSFAYYIINECGLEASYANEIAKIYAELFCEDNRKEWKENTEKGFCEFCEKSLHYDLDSSAVWESGHINYSCKVTFDIVVEEPAALHKALEKMLSKNPFTTVEQIADFLDKEFQKKLDSDFEEYCNEDDYYAPYIDDYEYPCMEMFEDICAKYGLHMSNFDLEGDEDD